MLGIAWLTPIKILTTFVEAFIILLIGVRLVKSRLMRNRTIEGPRKLLLLFTIGFLLKMTAGFTLQQSLPGFNAMDVYGFAYILPALLAMEMWPGRKVIQVTRITLQTSFLAAVSGLAITIGLQALYPETFQVQADARQETAAGPEIRKFREAESDLVAWLDESAARNRGWGADYRNLSTKSFRLMDDTLLTPLMHSLQSGDLNGLEPQMERVLRRTGYELVRLTDPGDGATYFILQENPSSNFRGTYIFRAGASQPIAIQVPQPRSEPGTLPVGIALFRHQNARALLISGSSKRKDYAEFDVTHLSCKRSLFQLVHQVIHREFAAGDPMLSLQVRGAADLSRMNMDAVISTGREIRSDLSPSDRLNRFRDNLAWYGLNVRFFRGDESDLHLSTHSIAQQAYVETFNMGEFAVVWFDDRLRQCFDNPDPDPLLIESLGWTTAEGDLAERIANAFPSGTGLNGDSNAEIPADPNATPNLFLQDIIREVTGFSNTGNVIHLQRLTEISMNRGYRITEFHDRPSGRKFIVLTAPPDAPVPCIICNYKPYTERILRIAREPAPAVRTALNRFSFSHPACAIPSGDTP